MTSVCIHEMSPASCGLCQAQVRRRNVDMTVYISPQRVGHLDGCTHKEDEDWSLWGEARRPGAWRALCNGEAITADAGAVVGIVAARACQTCVDSARNDG